ncbi:hypothetical protein ACOMHN_008745 [Nucella lapillus]
MTEISFCPKNLMGCCAGPPVEIVTDQKRAAENADPWTMKPELSPDWSLVNKGEHPCNCDKSYFSLMFSFLYFFPFFRLLS